MKPEITMYNIIKPQLLITKILFLALMLAGKMFYSQKNWDVKFFNEVNGREVEIFADNNEIMPISVSFDFELNNMTSSLANEQVVVIPAETKKFPLAKMKVVRPNAANSFRYTNTFNFGNALVKDHDSDYIYWLPFEKGKSKLVYQGYNGKFSHQDAAALDFSMDIGEKVYAAREGTVVEVVDSNARNCPDLSCARFNNYILIMHSDGTFADYSHLMQKGTVVKQGSKVQRGQHIGYSGNTGFSSGPHLHFSVFQNRIDGKRNHLKTKFKTSQQEATFLEEKKTYTKNY